jgi:signal transduction histidine kinase
MYSVYFYLKLKEKQKQKLLETKNNIARDLHDDMGSNLASIKILSELAMLKNGENETMEKIKKNVDNIQENLHDIIYNLKNDKYSLDQLIDKIKTYLIERVEVLDIKLDFNIKIESQNYELKPHESRNIFLIFKEVINNISKYSNATNVRLAILEDKNTLNISIQENGMGFDIQDTTIRGNGIDNMYSRAAEIKAKFNITSEKLNTTHNITLKLKQ